MSNEYDMNYSSNQNAAEYKDYDIPLAIAYVPMQKWTETYDYEEAFHKGTLFPDLFKPFTGRRMKSGL